MAAACASPEDDVTLASTAALDSEPGPVTVAWKYWVNDETNNDVHRRYDVEQPGRKDLVLSDIADDCGNLSQCEVRLTVEICARTTRCGPLVAEDIGWQQLVALWSDAQREQIRFLEERNVHAHWVESTLRQQRVSQQDMLETSTEIWHDANAERWRVARDTRDRLGEMAAQIRGEEVVRLATTRWAIRDLEEITQQYQEALDRIRPLYADVAQRFTAYRDGETAAIGALHELAARASSASLSEIPTLKAELGGHSGVENRTPQQLILDAQRARWELAHVQAEYEQALVRYDAMITSEGWPRLDHATAPREGMSNVVGYAESRLVRVNDAIRDLLAGLRRREQALVLVAADAATRDAVSASVAAHTEAAFLDEITTRTTELWRNPPTILPLNLPLLADRLRVMQAFLQLESICEVDMSTASWRAPGCQRISGELTKVRRYLSQTLPFTIRHGIRKLRAAGAVEADLATIEADVAAARLSAAVHRYDAVLRTAEGG